jgi:plastocyanin
MPRSEKALIAETSSGNGETFARFVRKEAMMAKKILIVLIVGSLLALLVSACSVKENSPVVIPTVHMGALGFIQNSITLQKGEMLGLIDDTISPHQIENGSWVNSVAKPAIEPGAPRVNQFFNGYDSAQVGPFSAAGTFHYYCAIHEEMNLTVDVV